MALGGLFKLLFHYAAQGETQKLNTLEESTHESITEVNHLLDNLLDWASSQTGALPCTRRSPYPSRQLFAEILTLFHQSAQAKRIFLTADVSDDLYLFADRNGVRAPFSGTWSATLSSLHPMAGKITLSATRQDDRVQLKVTDTGRGMGEQMLEEVVSTVAEKTSTQGTRSEKGSGLGIQLCRGICYTE